MQELPYPKWFSPLRMLSIFTGMSLIVYLDRGLIASTPVNGRSGTQGNPGSGIQGDFVLSNVQDGCLPAAFMVGLIVASPIFAALSKHVQPFKLVGWGLAIWTAAVASCAWSWGFWSLLVCRMVVGVGEASFVVLAAPFIDESAPPDLKSLWVAIFLMAIPVGYALGYIYGGMVGMYLGWRLCFLSEALFMLPFIIFAFRTKPVPLGVKGGAHVRSSDCAGGVEQDGGREDEEASDGAPSPPGPLEGDGDAMYERAALLPSVAVVEDEAGYWEDGYWEEGFWEDEDQDMLLDGDVRTVPPAWAVLRNDVLRVLRCRVYTSAVLGNTLQTALLGMYAYWGPKAVTYMFQLQDGHADVLFGGVTITTGIFGTLAGGLVLDSLGSSQYSAASVCLVAVAAGFMLLQLAFRVGLTLPGFTLLFAAGEFAIFMMQAPVTRIILVSVPTHLRPLAFSIQTIAIHVLGDVPSPPLAGWIHDHFFNVDDVAHKDSWRHTSVAFNCCLLLSAAFFVACVSFASVEAEKDRAAHPARDIPVGAARAILAHRRNYMNARSPPGWRDPRMPRLETVEEGGSSELGSTGFRSTGSLLGIEVS